MKNFMLLILFCVTITHAQCWQAVSSGADFCVAIKTDGTLYSWGHNESGQLGIGSFDDEYVPAKVGEDSDWQSVSAGYGFVIALKTNGTLWVWGRNDFGLGAISGNISNVPEQVGTDSDWVFINAGGAHSFAIKSNGTLWGWGRNDFGQLGNGSFAHTNVPTQVGTGNFWKTVAAGTFHSLAVKADNTLWSWGYNFSGQLGQGTAGFGTEVNTPTQILSLAANEWKSIDAGGRHSLAVTAEGKLWVWGNNNVNALGINDGSTYKAMPTLVNNATDWKLATGGTNHTFAIKENNTLWGWGQNTSGSLGDGSVLNRVVPVQIGTEAGWWRADGGELHSFFFKDGNIQTSGSNMYGQLGIGATGDHTVPISVDCPVLDATEPNKHFFTIYPNPVSDKLVIMNKESLKIEEYRIYDNTGKLLINTSGNPADINVKQLQGGVYLLQIHSEKGMSNFKFIKI